MHRTCGILVHVCYGSQDIHSGAMNLSRIRMGLSGLNQQRHKYRFIDSGRCSSCNFIREDAQHYFLKCPTYATQREVMLREICQNLAPNINPNLLLPQSTDEFREFLEIILNGSTQSDFDTNRKIFDVIHSFIHTSRRFS